MLCNIKWVRDYKHFKNMWFFSFNIQNDSENRLVFFEHNLHNGLLL